MDGKNMATAAGVIAWCLEHGVREIVICAGARNLPLVATVAAADGLRCWHHPEERSAAFFALGRVRSSGFPVAVIVTSGTAVAELLPAVIEAHYQRRPLLLLTADRPVRFRGTAAPQAIEQAGIFGPYADFLGDWESTAPPQGNWNRSGPAHWNLCFDEPLIDGPVVRPQARDVAAPEVHREPPPTDWMEFGRHGRLLVMVGGLEEDEREPVAAILAGLGAPVWMESTSNLWGRPELEPLWRREIGGAMAAGCTHVLRLGGVPCDRMWRDLESRPDIAVYSLSRAGWSGLGRPCQAAAVDFAGLPVPPRVAEPDWFPSARSAGVAFPQGTEKAWMAALSARIPTGARVFLGNSLPVREWQSAAVWRGDLTLAANRGANGIDGELSTFLGWAEGAPGEAWGIFGDLTTVYDLAAPWVLAQMENRPIRLVVINNGGGGIFARLPIMKEGGKTPLSLICNPHQLDFAHWAAFWSLPHVRATAPADLDDLPSGPVVVEIRPDDALV